MNAKLNFAIDGDHILILKIFRNAFSIRIHVSCELTEYGDHSMLQISSFSIVSIIAPIEIEENEMFICISKSRRSEEKQRQDNNNNIKMSSFKHLSLKRFTIAIS